MKKIRYAIVLLLSMSMTCTYANNLSVSIAQILEQKQSTMLDVFKLIESETDFVFIYSDDIKSDLNVNITPKKTNGSIDEILNPLFEKTKLTYQINGNQVVVKKKSELVGPPSVQQKKVSVVTGTVVDVTGEPLIGVNIWLKNSSVGAVTDIDGKYSIKIDGVGGVLTFSYMGMKSVDVAISNQSTINVTMTTDDEVLDEVVVVGYGRQKKESVVGAISTVDVSNLKVPGSSISNVLAGQLAGVVAMTRSGEPGKNSAADFYIRGVSSFKGTSTPLVLVDGIERDLDLVDTDDISSFSILKDASASAVYGVRGANGVILITTKKGNVGKPSINVRAEAGITSPTKMPKMINSAQWADLYNDIQPGYYTEDVINKYRTGEDPDLYPNVNWIDEMYNDLASNQRVNLSITGGTDIVKYYISGSFYNESSIFKSADNLYDYNSSVHYDKFNFRANVDLAVTKSTTLNLNLANIYEKRFAPGDGDDNNNNRIWGYTFETSPNAFPIEYSDGTIAAPSTDSGYNPWNMLVHSGYREQFWNSSQSLIGLTQDIGALWEPLEGLTGNFKFSWDAWNTTVQRRSKEPTQYHATGRDEDGNLIFGNPIRTGSGELGYSIGRDGTMTTYMEASLNYDHLFADKHRVGALFLYNHKIHTRTQDEDKFKSLPYKNQGIAGRVTYAFNDTYFAEVNMGYNGSENFARGHRFGFFPAGAIGWMVSNEKWFQPLTKVVDMLKLKGSYGIVGNDDIGGERRWVYESTILVGKDAGTWYYGSAGANGGEGVRVGDVENLSASWEEATKMNLGVEFSLFNDLRVQADYFHEKRTGIFLQRAGLPVLAGLSVIPYTNIGETMNQGFDGTVEYMRKVGEVTLTGRANFTYNRNELVNNDEPDWEYKYQNRVGKPFGSNGNLQPFGLVALGLFESQEEIDNSPKQTFGEYRIGDIKYQDINGDGQIDSQDKIAMGFTNLPEIVYGFGATAQWKNWDVNVFFQGVSHVNFFLGGSSIKSPFSSGNMERAAINDDVYDNVWRPGNTAEQNAGAIYPRLSWSGASGSSNNSQDSDWWMRNGSFLRLKNFEVGYTMSKGLMNKTFIKSLRFYISGNNLLTFSKFKLWDPEKGNGDGSGYPPNRVVTLGLNANF